LCTTLFDTYGALSSSLRANGSSRRWAKQAGFQSTPPSTAFA
jgi:hypothetical protein